MVTRRLAIAMAVAMVAATVATATQTVAQSVRKDDTMLHALGSVPVDDATLQIVIAYRADAAVLSVAIRSADGRRRYAPVFASPHRGIPAMDIDVHVQDGAVWVTATDETLGAIFFHRLGEETALTPFGPLPLSDKPIPDVLSGGPVPLPARDTAVRRATFYHRPDA